MDRTFTKKVGKVGNSKGVIIPENILEEMQIDNQDELVVNIHKVQRKKNKGINAIKLDYNPDDDGQLHVICPHCGNVSVCMDPYMEDYEKTVECVKCKNKIHIAGVFYALTEDDFKKYQKDKSILG